MALPNPGDKRKTMLRAYRQIPNIGKNMFLSTFFKTAPEDITDSEFISIDIERGDEEIAPVLTDISTGAVVVGEDIFTNKTIKPPAMALKTPFNVWDLMKRQFGETEYENPAFQAVLAGKVAKSWTKMTNMMKRTIEQQAADILQTGIITLYNSAGVAVYTLDYKMKATHLVTVGTAWSDVAADGIGDLEGLADVVRDDGLVDIVDVIMGSTSFNEFVNLTQAAKYFNKEGLFLGTLNPQLLNNGGKIQGQIDVGNYKFNVWTYNGRYIPLNTGTKTTYMNAGKVIMLPAAEDLDFRKAFGGIPVVVDSLAEVRQFLPSRVTVPGAFDFKPRVYTDEAAETTYSEIKSRPLLVPVSIDRFACLTT